MIWDADNDCMAGWHNFACDGVAHTKTYRGLDLSTKYYLKISNMSSANEISGSGRISYTKKA